MGAPYPVGGFEMLHRQILEMQRTRAAREAALHVLSRLEQFIDEAADEKPQPVRHLRLVKAGD